MREITSHKVNGCNEQLTVNAVDGPGPGGASHHYLIAGYTVAVPFDGEDGGYYENSVDLRFQNGPGASNGITHETLLAVLIDRLQGFQSGKFANQYNHSALGFLLAAQMVLKARTEERSARGVEGTMMP